MNKICKVVQKHSRKQSVVSELAQNKSECITFSFTAIVLSGLFSTSIIAAPTLVEDGLNTSDSKQATTLAKEAKQTAQSANSNATHALNTATKALNTINDVQSEFVIVKNTADAASLRSDLAMQNANTAQSTANLAVRNSNNAENTANAAKTTA